jgi:hypothetical protein
VPDRETLPLVPGLTKFVLKATPPEVLEMADQRMASHVRDRDALIERISKKNEDYIAELVTHLDKLLPKFKHVHGAARRKVIVRVIEDVLETTI